LAPPDALGGAGPGSCLRVPYGHARAAAGDRRALFLLEHRVSFGRLAADRDPCTAERRNGHPGTDGADGTDGSTSLDRFGLRASDCRRGGRTASAQGAPGDECPERATRSSLVRAASAVGTARVPCPRSHARSSGASQADVRQ
jgi:hypothetical protein